MTEPSTETTPDLPPPEDDLLDDSPVVEITQDNPYDSPEDNQDEAPEVDSTEATS